jgi:pyridoxine kinase
MSHRVLSIQSHVVHGYVGNKCAVFALQLHGIDVDPVNTVQFSNNTGSLIRARLYMSQTNRKDRFLSVILLTPPFGPELTCLTLFFAQGYPTWKGEALQADKMWALFEGLVENGLTSYSHVLTGASCDLR